MDAVAYTPTFAPARPVMFVAVPVLVHVTPSGEYWGCTAWPSVETRRR